MFRRCCLAAAAAMVALVPAAQAEMTTLERAWSWNGHSGYYLMSIPDGYDGQARLPLMISLHGGSGGSSPEYLYATYIPEMIAGGHEFEAIVLTPQSSGYWAADRAAAFIDFALATHANMIDLCRVYLTGESGGAFGAWRAAALRADKLAALLPCASMGSYTGGAESLVSLPIWAFHNVHDPYQPVEQTRSWVNAVIAAGNAHVQYTELTEYYGNEYNGIWPNCHEHGWIAAYTNPDVWQWFFAQGRPRLGDFNGDGYVTHGDYTVWADNFGWVGEPGGVGADGNRDGAVTHGDYTDWADHFGDGTPPANQPPLVHAGGDQVVQVPVVSVDLAGVVLDEGTPLSPGPVELAWSKVSGPGNVTFADAGSLETTATFSQSGTYALRLTAGDGQYEATDETTVRVDAADSERILTPVGWGQASGSGYCVATGAFDEQPTWDAAAGRPTGAAASPYTATKTAYAGRYWYIDLGPDFASTQITQAWTRYMPSSAGSYGGFAAMWWDDDIDTVNDNGVAETQLRFGSAQGVAASGDQQWIRDTDVTASPVVPPRRYLVISTGATPCTRANEFAIVGIMAPAPLTVQAGLAPRIMLPGKRGSPAASARALRRELRRQRIQERRDAASNAAKARRL